MIHPSSLLRSNSSAMHNVFSAPRNLNLGLNNFDCGLTRVPCLGKRLRLDRFAKVSVFVCILAVLGVFNGAAATYFKATSFMWRKHYQFNEQVAEWLVYSFDIYGGIFALAVGYWGNRIHRPCWVGGFAMFHAITGFMLLIPEFHYPDFVGIPIKSEASRYLCNSTRSYLMNNDDIDGSSYIALSVFMCYQLFQSFSAISAITLGVSYMDDHVTNKNSSICICIFFAAYELGKQCGIYISFIPIQFDLRVFFNAAWLITISFISIIGFSMVLFPRILPSKLMQRGVASILHLSERMRNVLPQLPTDDFWTIFRRIASNRIIVLNALSAAFMSIAVVNFELLENDFFRSQLVDVSVAFKTPHYQDPFQLQFFTKFFSQPLAIFFIILVGFIVRQCTPRPRSMLFYLIAVYSMVAILFASFAFLRCDDKIHSEHGFFVTYDNVKCNCILEEFVPVCSRNNSYYSPCYAGCKSMNETMYTDCIGGHEATPGVCNGEKCNFIWGFAQFSTIFRNALLGGTYVLHVLINMRSSMESDKSVALALHFTLVKVLPYLPFKIFYNVAKETMCWRRSYTGTCTFYNQHFVMILSGVTVMWMVTSIICALFILPVVNTITFYGMVSRKRRRLQLEPFIEHLDERESQRCAPPSPSTTGFSEEDINVELHNIDIEELEKNHAETAM